jgi:hypothetical protein
MVVSFICGGNPEYIYLHNLLLISLNNYEVIAFFKYMVYILPCAQKEVFTVKPSYFLIPQSIFNSRMPCNKSDQILHNHSNVLRLYLASYFGRYRSFYFLANPLEAVHNLFI